MDKRNFIKEIINKFTVKISQNEANDQLIASLIFLGKREDYCRSYPEISDIIYHLENKKFYNLKGNFALLDEITEDHYAGLLEDKKLVIYSEDEVKKDPSKKVENKEREAIKNNLLRFERHIQLSCYQRDYILSHTSEAERIASGAKETALGAEKSAKKAKVKVSHIYSEFVGILAIFTALSFAMMGSVQMLGNLFKDIKKPTTGSLGYALILAGIYLILIYLLIMTLVLGMKKLFSTVSEEYKISWVFVWIIFITATLLIVVGIFLIIIFKVSKFSIS